MASRLRNWLVIRTPGRDCSLDMFSLPFPRLARKHGFADGRSRVHESGAMSAARSPTVVAAAAAPRAAAAAGARRALLGLVHPKRAPLEHRAIHGADGRRRLMRVAHGHEAEAARLPALPIADDVHVGDLPRCRKRLTERLGCDAERMVANVKTIAHDLILSNGGPYR